MSIPHSPNLFFIVAYATLTIIGIELSALANASFGKSFGSFINVMCLCTAIYFALHLPKSSLFRTEWKNSTKFIKHLLARRMLMAMTFGFLATATDIVAFTLLKQHFNGTAHLLSPERHLLVTFLYCVITYILIGIVLRHKWKHRPKALETDEVLVSLFEDITIADRSVIKSALNDHNATINASRNSALDIFLRRLSMLGLAQSVEQINSVSKAPDQAELNLWKISDNGLKTIRSAGI